MIENIQSIGRSIGEIGQCQTIANVVAGRVVVKNKCIRVKVLEPESIEPIERGGVVVQQDRRCAIGQVFNK